MRELQLVKKEEQEGNDNEAPAQYPGDSFLCGCFSKPQSVPLRPLDLYGREQAETTG